MEGQYAWSDWHGMIGKENFVFVARFFFGGGGAYHA